AREIEDIADGFCVALVEEGVELRVNGISKPILVLAPPLGEDDALKLKHYSLTATVTDKRSAKLTQGLKRQIAINTGMNRYGCFGKELEEVLEIIPEGGLEGVYSHLYAADNAVESQKQLAAFKVAEEAVKRHSPEAIAHIAASGGTLSGGEYLCDGVRCGIALYGYAPAGFNADGLTPALKVYAPLSGETTVTGGGVGYNIADKKYDKLYTYRLGYADGFGRTIPLGEKTLCMDAFISTRKEKYMPVFTDADEYAKRCGTISYEVLCSVTRRSRKIYERPAPL
ncbi:MAG: alanine racemase, partial [Clostridia bacterium]|nr:alanine racemase [Clostridia bacterium]